MAELNKEEFKKKLGFLQYHVMAEKNTEAPFTGKYVNTKDQGIYRCAFCNNELFSSETKFDSGTGWPSFTEPKNISHIELKEDRSHGMVRTEVLCRKCSGHLGHVFNDGPKNKKRFCINSCSLELRKDK